MNNVLIAMLAPVFYFLGRLARKKKIRQKLVGAALLIAALIAGWLCAGAGEDATGAIVLSLTGIWMIAARKEVIL